MTILALQLDRAIPSCLCALFVGLAIHAESVNAQDQANLASVVTPVVKEGNCKPVPSQLQLTLPIRLPSGNKLDKKALDPAFENLSRLVKQSPLSSLCEAAPKFDCWSRNGISKEGVDILEISKSRILIRVACASSAYNSSSFFVTFGVSTVTGKNASLKVRGKPAASSLTNSIVLKGPALVLFPHHPEMLSGPHAVWGLRAYDAIVGAKAFDKKSASIFAYTKGMENGTIGHFHHFSFSPTDGLPRLKLSASKFVDDGKDAFHFDLEKSSRPPLTASWTRFKPKSELRGCLSDFQEISCRKISL